ncbi:MAG: UDP-N-acetylglucosamine 2-epimerase, partial [Pseudomonadota bacterium]
RGDAQLFVNLDHWVYWNVLRRCHALVGNSSSGIMEAPAVRVPVIDIGDRQKGRLRASNIVHADARRDDIAAAFARIDSDDFRDALSHVDNPYGDGRAGERIARVIADAPARTELLAKRALALVDGDAPAFQHDPST